MIGILLDNSGSPITAILIFITVALGLIFSLVLHELGHGYAALICGDPTAKHNGRLSLNPLKHLDPIGLAMLLTVGFGYAKPVPVNTRNFKNTRFGVFLVSVAGITVNLILCFILCLIYSIVKHFAYNYDVLLVINSLALINMFLFFFNLLPLYPLDGFHLLECCFKRPNKFTRFMHNYSMYILIVLVALSVLVDFFPINVPYWQFVDVLGTYLSYTAGFITEGFITLWDLIFGLF